MSKVYFISDLHLGHKQILEFSPSREGDTVLEHDHAIVVKWNSIVKKRDTVWVLGDVAWEVDSLKVLNEMNGTKILVMGNHDTFDLPVYLKYFKTVYGFKTYKGYWISHAPIHPVELRGRKNIHGHVHMNRVVNQYTGDPDENYIPVCVEYNNGYPILFEDIVNGNFT